MVQKFIALRLKGLALLAMPFLFVANCPAESLRVTAWNLETSRAPQSTDSDTPDGRIRAASAVLKKLNPDVILLQRVRDSQMCADLVHALKPADYNILI